MIALATISQSAFWQNEASNEPVIDEVRSVVGPGSALPLGGLDPLQSDVLIVLVAIGGRIRREPAQAYA